MGSDQTPSGRPARERPLAPDEVGEFLTRPTVQKLYEGRLERIELTRVRSYVGKALVRKGRPPQRVVRLARNHGLTETELIFVLCHEVAHHVAGVVERHSDLWREACAELVREAGELGLLPEYRVQQGVEMVLNGSASKFRGWPERAEKAEQQRKERRAEILERLQARGLQPGARVRFIYRRRVHIGEVVRVNRVTVSVGEVGGGRTILRVPFGRIIGVTDG